MLTSLHKDLTTPYKSNSLFFFIKAEAHSLAEELRLCCLCIRYKLARRDGFVGGLSLSYQGQAFILAIAMCKANTSRSVNLGTTPLHLDTIPYLLTKLQASCLHIIRIFANIAKRFCIQYLLIKSFFTFIHLIPPTGVFMINNQRNVRVGKPLTPIRIYLLCIIMCFS